MNTYNSKQSCIWIIWKGACAVNIPYRFHFIHILRSSRRNRNTLEPYSKRLALQESQRNETLETHFSLGSKSDMTTIFINGKMKWNPFATYIENISFDFICCWCVPFPISIAHLVNSTGIIFLLIHAPFCQFCLFSWVVIVDMWFTWNML